MFVSSQKSVERFNEVVGQVIVKKEIIALNNFYFIVFDEAISRESS